MSRNYEQSIVAERHGGVAVGSIAHRILLALRVNGRIEASQLDARLGNPSHALLNLEKRGLVVRPVKGRGQPSSTVFLTDAGRALVSADGPLARAKTLYHDLAL
jgi:DNA-binding MarR family transcriptional regulator